MKSRLSLKSGSSGNSCGKTVSMERVSSCFGPFFLSDFPYLSMTQTANRIKSPGASSPKELTNVRNIVFSLDSVMRDSSFAGHNLTWKTDENGHNGLGLAEGEPPKGRPRSSEDKRTSIKYCDMANGYTAHQESGAYYYMGQLEKKARVHANMARFTMLQTETVERKDDEDMALTCSDYPATSGYPIFPKAPLVHPHIFPVPALRPGIHRGSKSCPSCPWSSCGGIP